MAFSGGPQLDERIREILESTRKMTKDALHVWTLRVLSVPVVRNRCSKQFVTSVVWTDGVLQKRGTSENRQLEMMSCVGTGMVG